LGRQTGLFVDPLESQEKVYKAIMASNELPAETRRLIRDLRQLRNQVAHAKVVPTPDSAQAYLVAVERVIELGNRPAKSS
jgi:AmiR/NasT family two-component response regulator